jgi:hypothetical protein
MMCKLVVSELWVIKKEAAALEPAVSSGSGRGRLPNIYFLLDPHH